MHTFPTAVVPAGCRLRQLTVCSASMCRCCTTLMTQVPLQAAVIVFLASAGAGFITGANILVDGGFSLMLDAIPTFP